MADDRKKLENEEIQKGLEDFIDRQLGLDLSLAPGPEQKPEKRQSDIEKKPKTNTGSRSGNRIYDDMLVSSKSYLYGENHTSHHNDYEEDRPRKCRIDDYEEDRPRKRRVDDYEEDRPRRRRIDDYEEDRPRKRRIDDYEEDRSGRRRRSLYEDYDDRERNMAGKKKRNNKKKNKKKKSNKTAKAFLAFLAVMFVIVFGGIYMAVNHVYSKMSYEEVEEISGKPYKEDGVINVLLIGNDSRLGGADGRSDAMILVSISDKTKTITMTSFLRDMYVEIPGHDGNRLNAAYAYGGPKLLMETITKNFDIPIHRYALVNFEAFANLVDAVGGIDLEVTNEEVQLINGYLMEYNQLLNRDLTYDWLDENASGVVHLNGPQALAYTRNRYIGTDFGRTERQRKVLGEVFKKLPGAMTTNGSGVIDGLFPNLTTNLKERECYMIALSSWKIVGYEMVQQCVPVEGTYSNATIRSMSVLEVDFAANKQFLKETLYGK